MNTIKAYFAGLFDGEGSVYISKTGENTNLPRYQLNVSINNTYKPAIDTMHFCYGGAQQQIAGKRYNNLGNRDYWRITWAHEKASSFLRDIRPYSIIKAHEIDLAVEFQDHMNEYKNRFAGKGPAHPEYADAMGYRQFVHEQLKALKRREWTE